MLIDCEMEAGRYTVIWDGKDTGGSPVASGVYFYRIIYADYVEQCKMLLLK